MRNTILLKEWHFFDVDKVHDDVVDAEHESDDGHRVENGEVGI